jgi:hypothetical protein
LCDRLLARKLIQPEARKLQKRYLKHREHLFVFLYCKRLNNLVVCG